MTWYKEFGYGFNPLSIKPNEEHELFFDDKNLVDDVLVVIENRNNLILKGPLGTGKTSILKKIKDNFGGSRKLYYYNAYSASTPLDFERILKKAGNFFSRLFNIKSKDVVLFIDEAHHLDEDEIESINGYLQNNFKSVIIASSELNYKVPEILRTEFKNEINIDNFTENDALNIIKDRLTEDYIEIISDEEIKKLYKKSKTPREFLLNVEDFCKEKHN